MVLILAFSLALGHAEVTTGAPQTDRMAPPQSAPRNQLVAANSDLPPFQSLTLPSFQNAGDPSGYGSSPSSTYYVDNQNGSDSNSGNTPSQPFATIAKINSLQLSGGQTVAFKAGDEWHEQLNISQSGTSGAPITYTSYGDGAQPILSAADTAIGWNSGSGAAPQESCGAPAFCSGFESGNFGDWAASYNNNDTTASITTAQSAHGTHSMAIYSAGGVDTRGSVIHNIAVSGPNSTLAFRWYFLAPGGSLKSNSILRPLFLASHGTQAGFATMATDASGNPSTLDFYDTRHGLRILNPTPLTGYLPGQWNEIEIDIAIYATSGGGALYLNGNLLSQINNIDTSADQNIDSAEVGNAAFGGAIAPGGTIYFDDIKMSASANVGPFNAGIATNVWYRSQTTDPKLINFNGQAGIPVSSSGAIIAPNQFYWDGSTLYVYSLTNPSGMVEIPQRSYAIQSQGSSYITVSGLELRGAQISDLFCTNSCSHWIVQNNTVNDSYSTAVFFEVDGGSSVDGIYILNNIVKGSGAGGIQINNGVGIVYIIGNDVSDFAKMYSTSNGTQNMYADGIEMYSQSGREGTGYIGSNNVHEGGVGSSQDYGGGIHADTVAGADIELNHILNVNGDGIQIEKGSGSVARYNLIVNSGTHTYDAGLVIRAGEGSNVTNQLVEWNTIYGGWWACSLGIAENASYVIATNITIQKNICTGAASGTQFYADQGANNTGNVFFDNNFGVAAPNFILFNLVHAGSYSDFDTAVGTWTGSVEGDPQFFDPIHGDFTLQATSLAHGIGAYP